MDRLSGNEEVNLQRILSSIFHVDGRIFKHYLMLAWFPRYLEMFVQSQINLMDNNEYGSEESVEQSESIILPKHINYYLAIMAVSCYKCHYLMIILREQFLLSGGNIDWILFGLDKVDPKIKRIAKLNEIMAFKPWQVAQSEFEDLIHGGKSPCENWTIHEVLKATIIFSTYHGLCSLV